VIFGRTATRPNVEAEFLGGGRMIDFGEDREAGRLLLFDRGFKSGNGLFHRILARLGMSHWLSSALRRARGRQVLLHYLQDAREWFVARMHQMQ
jgi:hypothetical protein